MLAAHSSSAVTILRGTGTQTHEPLRDSRRIERRQPRRNQEGLPQEGTPAAPGREPLRGRSRRVQARHPRLRGALRPRKAPQLRHHRRRTGPRGLPRRRRLPGRRIQRLRRFRRPAEHVHRRRGRCPRPRIPRASGPGRPDYRLHQPAGRRVRRREDHRAPLRRDLQVLQRRRYRRGHPARNLHHLRRPRLHAAPRTVHPRHRHAAGRMSRLPRLRHRHQDPLPRMSRPGPRARRRAADLHDPRRRARSGTHPPARQG